MDKTLLSLSDFSLLESLESASSISESVSARLNSLTATIRPTIDAFAHGVHQIGQYRDAADRVAGMVLSACAEKLQEREKEGRRRAIGGDGDINKDDFAGVLRILSRLER